MLRKPIVFIERGSVLIGPKRAGLASHVAAPQGEKFGRTDHYYLRSDFASPLENPMANNTFADASSTIPLWTPMVSSMTSSIGDVATFVVLVLGVSKIFSA